ncbi:MAG: type II toxin-antitoxin system Phd/YefM family antitoxin [Candidatus Methanomethylophilaceae archaeon]|nr:type II toxin-antitoxin system Phd/YefM family antitoxin [Candidatus Methanomethylophilaceae archaeon]
MIVVPSSELRNSYTELTDKYLSTNQPIYLTKNGHGHAVLISIEEYERLTREDMIRKIRDGIEAARNGDVMSPDEAEAQIRKELGL